MKRLKILVSLVGMFAVFSFVNVSAMEGEINTDTNKNKDLYYNTYNNETFKIDQFEEIYKIIREDENFNKNFFEEIEKIATHKWNYESFEQDDEHYYDNQGRYKGTNYVKRPRHIFGIKTIYDETENRLEPISKEEYLKNLIDEYCWFKEPVIFDKVFEDKVHNLNFRKITDLIFENYNANWDAGFNLMLKKDCVKNVANELKKLLDDYKKFKITIKNSNVMCNPINNKGEELQELINYCIHILRLGEFIKQKPELINKWYQYLIENYVDSDSEI